MNSTKYRRLMTGAAIALAVLVGAVWVINPLGEDAALPDPLERVFPLPGDIVVRQTAIEVDLPVGYSLELIVDGVAIPEFEVATTPATGQFLWQPGPTTLFELWTAGEHTVTIAWESARGLDPGSFTWIFRIT